MSNKFKGPKMCFKHLKFMEGNFKLGLQYKGWHDVLTA